MADAASIKVVAVERGFYGGLIRDEGAPFSFVGPGDKPAWMKEVEAAAAEPFAGKGDHDGDGKPGGSLPGDASTAAKGKGRKGKAAAETVQPEAAEPFADPPAPADAPKGNGLAEALGTDPDWVAKPVAI